MWSVIHRITQDQRHHLPILAWQLLFCSQYCSSGLCLQNIVSGVFAFFFFFFSFAVWLLCLKNLEELQGGISFYRFCFESFGRKSWEESCQAAGIQGWQAEEPGRKAHSHGSVSSSHCWDLNGNVFPDSAGNWTTCTWETTEIIYTELWIQGNVWTRRGDWSCSRKGKCNRADRSFLQCK